MPQTTMAKKEVKAPSENLVKVGLINGNSYDSKLMLELNRLTAKSRRKRAVEPGTKLFGYFEDGQEPKDADKPKYHGEVKADLKVRGIDGGEFPWKDIFGSEEVHLRFIQMNDDTGVETGTERVLNVSQAGKYTWTDGDGEPAELPLFNNKLEPLTYEVKLDEEVSDRVKLLTARLTKTDNASPTFDLPDNEGRIKYHLTLEIGLQQVASSKFVSEWHTAVEEGERPQIQGTMTTAKKVAIFNLPKNDTDSVVIRTNSVKEGKKPDKIFANFLYNKPTDIKVKTDTQGLTFEEKNGVKTVKSGDHKYKYSFTYDVINGGKLTMTELLPVTFDANGGKFASITDENAEQKIVKEVEYNGTLTDKAEEPKKALETFKGWEIKDNQGKISPVTDEAFKNIKEAKTFYAIWDNNEITAEELEVKESFKDGAGYVNDFIPTLDQLKGQVKIKDTNNSLKNLTNEKFEILKDDGTTPFTDQEVKDGILKTYLYDKLLEKSNQNDEPTRIETVKAKVTHKNGTSQTVDISIKVIKNIYEAKTLTEKPYYVPKDYVKVTLDPTTKAQDPQKTYYYVNKEAKVVIPGKDPVGVGDNKFVKWTYTDNGTETEYKLSEKPRHQFKADTTIEAQYVSDVIPQEGDTKPSYVPDNFKKVTFDSTKNGTLEGAKVFWVNPEKEVTIPVKDAAGKEGFTFKGWKIGDDSYKPIEKKKFTDNTTVTASYDQAGLIIPYDPSSPLTKPEGYIRVSYQADEGLTLSNVKFYYVKKNAKDANGKRLTLADLTKPSYTADTGYTFEKWYPEKDAIGDLDIT
ncbi:InlB B-repeat-containing protein, partial [Urinicoccus massiliensis]|uniref:InlB B-repeat-containing protein n=1 Tax=Urinicoccus massiliensis TaxID=1723382 RepID=UPI001C615732